MTCRIARFEGDPSEWDAFVRSCEGSTHFQLHGWKTVMERVFGHECIYLAALGRNGIAGVLPLVRVKSFVFGHYLVSMPFLNYGGPLGPPTAARQLGDHAVTLAQDGGVELLELRSRTPLDLNLPVSHRKVTVVLDLPAGDPEPLWGSFKAKVRSQVRRPQKEGVKVVFGLDQLEPFYAVFSRHMRDLGTPAQSRKFFQVIAEIFAEDVWFGCAYYRKQPVAAGCGFLWEGEFEMTWASSLRRYNPLAPNMLLYWSFMERCIEHSADRFNFGRCTPGGRTHRFKRQWGSRDEPLWWYQYSTVKCDSTPSPDDPAYAWGPRVWKRLPLPVTNVVGPRLVQYIP